MTEMAEYCKRIRRTYAQSLTRKGTAPMLHDALPALRRQVNIRAAQLLALDHEVRGLQQVRCQIERELHALVKHCLALVRQQQKEDAL